MKATPEQWATKPGYAKWLESLPWTQEEIIAALNSEAEAFRASGQEFFARQTEWSAWSCSRGWLTSKGFAFALPRLITTCGVEGCSRKALYRAGLQGRCSTHRLVPEDKSLARRRRLEAVSVGISHRRNLHDRAMRVIDHKAKLEQRRGQKA